jgi:hypothetical protein
MARSADLASEDSLRQHADLAFAEADVTSALRYLYADALMRPQSGVWQSIRWSPLLARPALAIRFGAVVQLDDLASQSTKIPIGERLANLRGGHDAQAQYATAFDRQTTKLGGPLVITWLRQSYDEGRFGDLDLIRAPSERALRGATYLAADTPSETLRAARAADLDFLIVFDVHGVQSAGAAPAISATAKVIDVANRRDLELHAPKARLLPAARAQLLKDVETMLKALGKAGGWSDPPAEIDAAAVESRVKAAAARKSENPLDLLVELVWYNREKRLPADKVRAYLEMLASPADAKTLLSGDEAARAALLAKWVPVRAGT